MSELVEVGILLLFCVLLALLRRRIVRLSREKREQAAVDRAAAEKQSAALQANADGHRWQH